jgi:hypothetical protein
MFDRKQRYYFSCMRYGKRTVTGSDENGNYTSAFALFQKVNYYSASQAMNVFLSFG